MKHLFNTFKYAWIDYKLQKEVKRRYYCDSLFSKLDRELLTAYIFKNPYTISRTYLARRRAADIHTYGETPLTTYEAIAQAADLKPSDTFLELGSGRGRGALFLHHFYGCGVIGIERIPQFVKLARHLVQEHQLEGISFVCGDMIEAKLPTATVIYLYGTSLADEEIALLITNFKSFPKGTKIITVSYPLTDYDENAFEIRKQFTASFPWGETDTFVQIVL